MLGKGRVGPLSRAGEPIEPPDGVSTDLVEYFILAVSDLASLSIVAPALTKLVQQAAIRILDLVVLVKDDSGGVEALELDAVDALEPLRRQGVAIDRMLSGHDLELASLALRPGTAAVVVVTEDRWAESLSVAAQLAGGQIIAGERIPAARVEAALAERPTDLRRDDHGAPR